MFGIVLGLFLCSSLRVFAQTVCDDVDTQVCTGFYRRMEMCDDPCYSKLCPRTCKKCPLRCYSCDGVTSVNDCNITRYCPTIDHKCVISESYGADFSVVFKLGCATTDVCRNVFGYDSSLVVIGRDEPEKRNTLNGKCCDSDLCNTRMRKRESAVSRQVAMDNGTSICTDIDTASCQRLSTIKQGMCNDPCMAKACAKTCGNCAGCYSCSHVTKTETCNNIVSCLPGEKCYTLETLSSSGEHGYQLGCVHQDVCSSFHNQAAHVFGRRSDPIQLSLDGDCCNGSLCNHHALIHPTQSSITTGCLYLSEEHHCPVGFELYAGRCYLVGDEKYNFTEAQMFCGFHCAKLAEDLTIDDMRDLQGIVDDNYVFTGAVDPSHSGNFVWKTSGRPAPSVSDHGHRYNDNTCSTLHFSSRDNPILFTAYCHYHYRPLCQAPMK